LFIFNKTQTAVWVFLWGNLTRIESARAVAREPSRSDVPDVPDVPQAPEVPQVPDVLA